MSKISVDTVLNQIANCLVPSQHGIQPIYEIGQARYRFLSQGEQISVTDSANEEHFFEALQTGIFGEYTKTSPNDITSPHWLFLLPGSTEDIDWLFRSILLQMDEITLDRTSVALASQRVFLETSHQKAARRKQITH